LDFPFLIEQKSRGSVFLGVLGKNKNAEKAGTFPF